MAMLGLALVSSAAPLPPPPLAGNLTWTMEQEMACSQQPLPQDEHGCSVASSVEFKTGISKVPWLPPMHMHIWVQAHWRWQQTHLLAWEHCLTCQHWVSNTLKACPDPPAFGHCKEKCIVEDVGVQETSLTIKVAQHFCGFTSRFVKSHKQKQKRAFKSQRN